MSTRARPGVQDQRGNRGTRLLVRQRLIRCSLNSIARWPDCWNTRSNYAGNALLKLGNSFLVRGADDICPSACGQGRRGPRKVLERPASMSGHLALYLGMTLSMQELVVSMLGRSSRGNEEEQTDCQTSIGGDRNGAPQGWSCIFRNANLTCLSSTFEHRSSRQQLQKAA